MDFLDPKKQRAHIVRLYVGYFLIGIAILFATVILLYQAYGFGLARDGEVVHNGLVFVSSQPRGAQIYLNAKPEKNTTNTKLHIPGGSYKLELQREGYHSWEKDFRLEGGVVENFEYPLLLPAEPVTTSVKEYDGLPGLSTNSPDRRWIIVQQPGNVLGFDVFDVSSPRLVKERADSISLPEDLVSQPAGGNGWKLVEWANNNRHVLLEYNTSEFKEYILLDRSEPENSINLTRLFGLEPGVSVSLKDRKFDKFYLFNEQARLLQSAALGDDPEIRIELEGALGFKAYGSDRLLYATETDAEPGMVAVMLREDDTIYKIRQVPAGGPYILDLAQFDGSWFVVAGSAASERTYVYKNPQTVRRAGTLKELVPVRTLRVTNPQFVSFSSNSQFMMVQGGAKIATYNVKKDRSYSYELNEPIDAPATNARWMDGHRLVYVSGGKLLMMDYDDSNRHSFMSMIPGSEPFFDRNYRYVYAVAPGGTPESAALTSTSLLTEADL